MTSIASITFLAASVLTVEQARAIVDGGNRKGKVVRVRGYVSDECARGCALMAEKGDVDWGGLHLSLSVTSAEAGLRKRRGELITLRARVGEPSSRTLSNGDLSVCADRCAELIPLAVED